MSSIIRVKMSILRKKGFKIWIYDPSHEQLTCNDPVIIQAAYKLSNKLSYKLSHEQLTCNDPVITFNILFLELKLDISIRYVDKPIHRQI